MRIPPSLLLAALCLVGLVALHNSALAATYYWDNNGTAAANARILEGGRPIADVPAVKILQNS